MNSYTLNFQDPYQEKLYYQDQVKELILFYKWVACLGTLSAIGVFTMEFINPFGFGYYKYGLLVLPFSFYLSNIFMQRYPIYFNWIVGFMNVSLGIFCDALLIIFFESDILFLAGQTVALVQYSLLIGTNLTSNLIILFINQISLLIIDSIIHKFFNAMQIMFILALILIMKALYCNEKNKRNFFLLKQQNQNLQQTLDRAFRLNLIKCTYSKRQRNVIMLEQNKNSKKIIKDQQAFTEFIRSYDLFDGSKFSLSSRFTRQNSDKNRTFESKLIQSFKRQDQQDQAESLQIYNQKGDNSYIASIFKCIENDKNIIMILLSEDKYTKTIIQQRQQIKNKTNIINQFLEQTDQLKHIMFYLKSIQQNPIFNNDYLQFNQQKLYRVINHLYNLKLIVNHDKISQCSKFLVQDLMRGIIDIHYQLYQKKKLIIRSYDNNLIISSNYLLILQLITNEIYFYLETQSILNIQIKISKNIELLTDCINIEIEFELSENASQIDYFKDNVIFEQSNHLIQKYLCYDEDSFPFRCGSKIIKTFNIIQDLPKFKDRVL